MESKEKKYRTTSKKSGKYVKHLEEYVVDLLSRGRVVEALHYHKELCSLKPDRTRVIELGYELSIRTFRFDEAEYYDRELLDKLANNKKRLIFLRIKLYHALHNKNMVASCLKWFFDEGGVHEKNRDEILDIALSYDSHGIDKLVLQYLQKQRLILGGGGMKKLKRNAVQALVDGLSEVCNAKLSCGKSS
ncbi:hypothetical protein [Halomonas salina]|uniref:hypothetical protein n=1 Tax=Halomonas salina TaxID=42565 RepID=UPI0012690B7B|nr:hypothetical protein [Halomonas salina]